MTPQIGDNSNNADKERRVLFAHYHRKDRDIAARIREANEEKKSNRQNAKANGFPAQKLDHYLKAFMAEDQQKPVDKLKSELENLCWLGLIPSQDMKGDLLTKIDRVDAEQMVQARGFEAGLNGLDRVSNYDAGGPDDRMWLDSYDAGRAEFDAFIPGVLERINSTTESKPPVINEGDNPYTL